jgi:hypothetical protein
MQDLPSEPHLQEHRRERHVRALLAAGRHEFSCSFSGDHSANAEVRGVVRGGHVIADRRRDRLNANEADPSARQEDCRVGDDVASAGRDRHRRRASVR